MNADSCYQIGYVTKRHGLKGAVKVRLERDLPQQFESIFIAIQNRLIPFFVSRFSVVKNEGIFWFEDIHSPEGADELVSSKLYLPKELFPNPVETSTLESKYLGFDVYSYSKLLGKVVAVDSTPIHPLLKVDMDGKEIVIPVQDHFISKINHSKKIIEVVLPDGFLEI